MYYIAICDDDPVFLDYLENAIRKVNVLKDGVLSIHKYTSGQELIDDFSKGIVFELVIIDMAMDVMDGNETAKLFREQYPTSLLVFCSGVCLPNADTFEPGVLRYLLKSYDDARMHKELRFILNMVKKKHDVRDIAITFNTTLRYIEQENILYVYKRKHGCELVLMDRKNDTTEHIKCNKTLTELYEEVDHSIFAYPHGSYFVNLECIAQINYRKMILVDGTELSITQTRSKEFREQFVRYTGRLENERK